MKTGREFLNEHIEETNIPAEHWEIEIGEMMDWYAYYYHQAKLKLLDTPIVSQQRELFYNFITWYNAKPKVKKPKDGLITTNIIEDYLKL